MRAFFRRVSGAIRFHVDEQRRRRIDRRIPENIRTFQAKIDPERVAAYRRSADWQRRIEVVIPCFNHARYLAEAFDSVISQTYPQPIAVTFVDDSSTDDSLAEMRRLEESSRASRVTVRVLHNERNLNQSGSINRAISTSDSALLVVLNADDLLTPDCLELIVKTYEAHCDLALLGGGNLPFEDGHPRPAYEAKAREQLLLRRYGPAQARSFDHLNSVDMSHSSSSFFRGAWELVGGYFELAARVCTYDDRDFQMRVCSLLPIGVYPHHPMQFYRTNSSHQRGTT